MPETVTLKPASAFRLIGNPAGRLDAADKSSGRQDFGMGARRPGMKTVLVARPPTFGGKVAHFDATAARAVKGVEDVMEVDLDRGATGIAVVADGYWPAKMGRDALDVTWGEPAERVDTDRLAEQFRGLLGKPGLPARKADVSALAGAATTITAEFTFPFLAHAPMEPHDALIERTGASGEARCALWAGTQFQTIDEGTVAGEPVCSLPIRSV